MFYCPSSKHEAFIFGSQHLQPCNKGSTQPPLFPAPVLLWCVISVLFPMPFFEAVSHTRMSETDLVCLYLCLPLTCFFSVFLSTSLPSIYCGWMFILKAFLHQLLVCLVIWMFRGHQIPNCLSIAHFLAYAIELYWSLTSSPQNQYGEMEWLHSVLVCSVLFYPWYSIWSPEYC